MTFFLPLSSAYSVIICETVSTAAVPIFFILSGYLFFVKPFSKRRLKNQLLRLLKLYLAWKVIYFPIFLLEKTKDNVPFVEGVCMFIRDLFFPSSHLWYLPALIFALAFVSLIRNMKTRYAVIVSTALFIMGLLFDTYKFLIPRLSGVIEAYGKVFFSARNGLFFGMIYVYLGYVFSQLDFEIKRFQAALGVAASLLLLCAEGILLFKCRGIKLTDITIFALPVSVFVFLFALRQEVKIKEDRLLLIRKLSTALYCVHPFFIVGFLFINYIVAIPPICTFASIMLGATVASIIIVRLGEKYKLISYLI